MKNTSPNLTTTWLLLFWIGLASTNHFSICANSKFPSHSFSSKEAVQVTLHLIDRSPSKLEFELIVQNVGKSPLYITANPLGRNGAKGVYVHADLDKKTLELSTHFYSPPGSIIIELDQTCVELKKLSPGELFSEKFSLHLPLFETTPPNYLIALPVEIDLTQITSVRALVGVLPYDKGIEKLINQMLVGSCVKAGDDVLTGPFKGTELIDLQTIVCSASILLPSASPHTARNIPVQNGSK